jgi:hypothetical protein
MGERKVLNRYFPPDFDPAKIPRKRMDAKYAMNIRMMMPMSIQVRLASPVLLPRRWPLAIPLRFGSSRPRPLPLSLLLR